MWSTCSQGSVDALLWKARFSSSVGYQRVSEGTTEYRRIYTSARAKCIQYQLSVNYKHAPVGVTDNFRKAVNSLPLERNDNAYHSFINTYGTHFTGSVTMGAKMVIRTEFDETALTRMEETGLSIEIGAQVSSTFETKLVAGRSPYSFPSSLFSHLFFPSLLAVIFSLFWHPFSYL